MHSTRSATINRSVVLRRVHNPYKCQRLTSQLCPLLYCTASRPACRLGQSLPPRRWDQPPSQSKLEHYLEVRRSPPGQRLTHTMGQPQAWSPSNCNRPLVRPQTSTLQFQGSRPSQQNGNLPRSRSLAGAAPHLCILHHRLGGRRCFDACFERSGNTCGAVLH
jgi:hypothetical protein